MKLTVIIMIVSLMQVSASTFGQNVTLKESRMPLEKVFKEIRKQTGYDIFLSAKQVKLSTVVSVDFDNVPLKNVIDKVLSGLPLTYTIDQKTIVIKEVEKSLIDKVADYFALIDVSGKVVDDKGVALGGATVKIKGTNIIVSTNENGEFLLKNVDDNAVLEISFLGFKIREVKAVKSLGTITLEVLTGDLAEVEVVNTGYQTLDKARSTGSFVKIDNELFNRKVGSDILSRLDGIVPSLLFDKRPDPSGNAQTKLQLRGLYTLTDNISQPLIVLDNFPYEGNLKDINANDVENITILRDAAATSIWGARAGNGVIVITTKKGRFNQSPNVSFTGNLTLIDKPDLFKLPLLGSSEFIDLEMDLFSKGLYDNEPFDIYSSSSPVVKILFKERNGEITSSQAKSSIDAFRGLDNRNDFLKYIYRKEINQQYGANINGGNDKSSYLFSVGVNKSLATLVGNDERTITLKSNSSFKLSKKLQIDLSLSYANGLTNNNSVGDYNSSSFRSLNNRLMPIYSGIADQNGNPTVFDLFSSNFTDTVGNGRLLDWKYRPLQELYTNNNKTNSSALLGNINLKYDISKEISFGLLYQNQLTEGENNFLRTTESYFTRNFINTYTNLNAPNFTRAQYPVPLGGILENSYNQITSNNFRSYLSFAKILNKHSINIYAGAELSDTKRKSDFFRNFGIDSRLNSLPVDLVNPYPTIFGYDQVIDGLGRPSYSKEITRNVSYFINGSYSFEDKYTLSASARYDGSNIYGLKTNQKFNPFWSVGLGWDLSKEDFYNIDLISKLKARATYGFNGNTDPGTTALTIVDYISGSFNFLTNIPYATLSTLPNPGLKWETVKNINFGVDFSFKNNRLLGSLDYYQKNSKDVIYTQILDPTIGQDVLRTNSAKLKGNGFETQLQATNIKSKNFNWISNFSFTYVNYKVSDLKLITNSNIFLGDGSLIFPIIGFSPYEIRAFKWGGLNPKDGSPIGIIDNKKVYSLDSIYRFSKPTDLVNVGSNIPKYFGNFMNTFSYKNFSLSTNFTYRLGYYYKRETIDYEGLINKYSTNRDYLIRWQKPGDELTTNVPSFIYPLDSRINFYNSSEIMYEKGDNIRLDDIKLNFKTGRKTLSKLPFKSFDIYMYTSNLNLVIWKASKIDVDPEYPRALKRGTSFSFGIRGGF